MLQSARGVTGIFAPNRANMLPSGLGRNDSFNSHSVWEGRAEW